MLLSEVWAWKTEGDDHHRALLNTCLACLAAYLTAFPASSLTHPRRKVAVVSDMDDRKEWKGKLIAEFKYLSESFGAVSIEVIIKHYSSVKILW